VVEEGVNGRKGEWLEGAWELGRERRIFSWGKEGGWGEGGRPSRLEEGRGVEGGGQGEVGIKGRSRIWGGGGIIWVEGRGRRR